MDTNAVPVIPATSDVMPQQEPASSKLIDVLVGLRGVSERNELLAWAEALLDQIVAFSSIACVLAEPHRRGFRVRDIIASGPLAEHMAAIDLANESMKDGPTMDCDIAQSPTVLIDRWMRERRALRLCTAEARAGAGDERLATLLACLGTEAVVVHGVKEAFSGSTTFLVLGTAADPAIAPSALETLELIMPSVHVARQRIHRFECARGIRQPTIGLTPREARVLSLIAAGMTDDEAARETGRSVHTIKNQVRHLVQKFGARNRLHAVLIASRHGLLDEAA